MQGPFHLPFAEAPWGKKSPVVIDSLSNQQGKMLKKCSEANGCPMATREDHYKDMFSLEGKSHHGKNLEPKGNLINPHIMCHQQVLVIIAGAEPGSALAG